MARNVIYYNNSDNQIPLAGIANLPYTDVILCFLLPDNNLNVHPDGGGFGNDFQSNIRALQNAGKKVLISLGGTTRGNDEIFPSALWRRCAQDVDTLANNIATFVNNNGFDGVDIDYEDNNGFITGGYKGVEFLSTLTARLYQALPPGRKIITHAPQTVYWYPGDYGAAYQEIWRRVGNQIAWFNNQFYSNPGWDRDAATKVKTYHDIVNIPEGPPPQKLLVGALLAPGDGYIPLSDMVQNVIAPLKAAYGDQFGGAVFTRSKWQLG